MQILKVLKSILTYFMFFFHKKSENHQGKRIIKNIFIKVGARE